MKCMPYDENEPSRVVETQRIPNISCEAGDSEEKPTLCLDEVSALLTCAACKALPMTSQTVHACAGGHQVCDTCFIGGHQTCEVCQTPLEGRNEVLEEVLGRLRQVCPGLFPQEQPARLGQDQAESGCTSLGKHSRPQRPLACPLLFCRRVVGSTELFGHFRREHPSVPHLDMTPGHPHNFSLTAGNFLDFYPRAISVIEVDLAAGRGGEEQGERRDALLCVLLGAAVRYEAGVFLVAWCCCLQAEPLLNYHLRATATTGSETLYTGPTRSAYLSQHPEAMLRDAQCLVLSSGAFTQRDTQCKEPITLSLLFKLIS